MNDYTHYVHECYKDGHGQYFVGEWSERNGQYTIPLMARERRLNLTGTAWFSRKCGYMPHFDTRSKALRYARHVFGPPR